MRAHEFYRRFADIPQNKRDAILEGVRHDPLTPFLIYKELQEVLKMQRIYKHREEELLRIAEETFGQVE